MAILPTPPASSLERSSRARASLAVLEQYRSEKTNWKRLFPKCGAHRVAHLVLQGGGTLGIAHVGFMRGLEAAGIRFAGLGGTSAGAIIALLAAAARRSISEEVSSRLMPCLESMPASSFIDGPHRARRVVKAALKGESLWSLEWLIPIRSALRRVRTSYGLNPGTAFEEWLAEILAERFELRSLLDLNSRLRVTAAELGKYLGFPGGDVHAQSLLHLVATAMPTGTKFVFPADLLLLAEKTMQRSPAVLARASMSVPLFFEPLELDLDTVNWRRYCGAVLSAFFGDETLRELRALRQVHFVDGGTLSNFPIDAFLDIAQEHRWRLSPEERATLGMR